MARLRPVGCREAPSLGEGRERCSIWVHAVSRQPHGACCFSMTSAARPGALVSMDQAVIHMATSYGRLMDSCTGCYYSATWSWVKPLTIPEVPPIGLYNTCLVEGLSSLCEICAPSLIFLCTEVVLCNRKGSAITTVPDTVAVASRLSAEIVRCKLSKSVDGRCKLGGEISRIRRES
eukprot:816349-Prymnesium_polylepis.1